MALVDLIAADVASYGGFNLRLGDLPGSTVADNATGSTDGAYTGSPSLGNLPLYADGDQSMRVTGISQRALFPGASVPSLPSMTVGILFNVAAVTSQRHLVCRDAAAGPRYFAWRINGANIEFQKYAGTTETSAVFAHGISAGYNHFAIVTVSATGTVKQFLDGVKMLTTAYAAADYGGASATDITVANRGAHNEAVSGDSFAEFFVIATELSEARVAEYSAAAQLVFANFMDRYPDMTEMCNKVFVPAPAYGGEGGGPSTPTTRAYGFVG